MRTKDEILDDCNGGELAVNECFFFEGEVLKAMDEYAKQVAMMFHRWAYESRYSKYWGSDKPNNQKWYKQYTPPARTYYTDEELFDIFKKENNL